MLGVTSAQGYSHLVKLQIIPTLVSLQQGWEAQGGSGEQWLLLLHLLLTGMGSPSLLPCFWSSPNSFILLYLVPAVSKFCAFNFLLFLVPHLESLYHFPLFAILGNQPKDIPMLNNVLPLTFILSPYIDIENVFYQIF